MTTDANLITSNVFNGQDFLVKMNLMNNYLEIVLTDKQSGEEWQCSYDHAYIENLTHKTGNFKQFHIFTTMLKSGLLKTSNCLSLELLTYEDLEALRVRRIKSNQSKMMFNKPQSNRRYLILIYNVEFDRILYPLPLEYCGPPDPVILQGTIKKLEAELAKTKEQLKGRSSCSDSRQVVGMEKRIDDLLAENAQLHEEVRHLIRATTDGSKSKSQLYVLQSALTKLENSVASERKTHYKLLENMRREKSQLLREIDRLQNENTSLLRTSKMQNIYRSPTRLKRFGDLGTGDTTSIKTIYKKNPNAINRTANQIKSRNMSPSPRKTKSETWNRTEKQQPNRRNNNLTNQKIIRSRSSSRSSSKHMDQETLYNNDKARSRTNSKERASRRQSSLDRSSSDGSLATSVHRSRSSQLLKARLKSSEEEFKSLENRISSLQKMLQENVNL